MRKKEKVIFKQSIKIKNLAEVATIKFNWEYMTCNNERCLAPTERCAKFKFQPQNRRINTITAGQTCITKTVDSN